LFIPEPDPDFLPMPDPRSRGQKGTWSRIPDPGSGSATLCNRLSCPTGWTALPSENIYRPSFCENKPKTLVFYNWKRAFWACFRENWVYKFGHAAFFSKGGETLWGHNTRVYFWWIWKG
jgi:hypothetical protein